MTTHEEMSLDDSEASSGICCSLHACSVYFMIAFSGLLLFIGMFLALFLFDYKWLLISGIGVILLLFGTCMHYWWIDKPNSNKRQQQRLRLKEESHSHQARIHRLEQEDLLPSAPLHNAFSSASQLCLLPSYGHTDDASIVTHPSASISNQNFSQIILNGQNFLLVPMNADGSVTDTTSLLCRQNTQSSDCPSSSDFRNHRESISAGSIPPSQSSRPKQEQGEHPHASQLYVTILGNEQNQTQAASLTSESFDAVSDPQHSSINEEIDPADQVESPATESNFDLSSNASTVLDNFAASATIPADTTNLSNEESQRLVGGPEVSPEVMAMGGATGLNVNHPDYVSASDDETISCGRSSPPPSYAEVAQEDGFSAV